MYTGPHLIKDNLVFGYDTGYGIDQHSSTRHYKGEPATNLITSGLPGYFGSGGETLYKSRYYGLNSDSGVFQRNFVTNPATANTSAFNNNAGLYKNFTSANLSSSTEYVLVSFDFYMITPYVRHSSSSTGLNGYMGIRYTDGSTGNHSWNTSLNTPNAGDDWNNNSAYIGQWRKIALYVDLTNSKTPSFINTMYIYNDRTIKGEGIFTNFIITEHATLPTGPILYTPGTRSSTQSLIDLKSTTDIDVANVSFDSTGQLTFDGTDDRIAISNIPNKPVSQITCEAVINPSRTPSTGTIRGTAIGDQSTLYLGIINSIDAGVGHALHWALPLSNGSRPSSWHGSIPKDEFTHIVGTYDGSTTRAYVNGVEVWYASASGTVGGTTYNVGIYNNRTNDGTHNFEGPIPIVKIYNKGLSPQEVKQNFNAYKNRFGI